MSDVIIRSETERDRSAVRRVNREAFGRPAEAALVEALYDATAEVIGLVAEAAGVVIGHILFSPVEVQINTGKSLVGLAPVSVLPEYQGLGYGSQLVRVGLSRCEAAGCDGVIVLGSPSFYGQFGFRPAHLFGLRCEYDVPRDAFMVQPLAGRSLAGVSGLVRYHPAFTQVSGGG